MRRAPSLLSIALTCLAGLTAAAGLLAWAGLADGSGQLLGVQIGYQSPPVPAANWHQALAHEIDERGLERCELDPWSTRLEYTSAPRRCFYRTRLTAERAGRRVAVDVVLTAPDRGAWRVQEWRETP